MLTFCVRITVHESMAQAGDQISPEEYSENCQKLPRSNEIMMWLMSGLNTDLLSDPLPHELLGFCFIWSLTTPFHR